MTKKKPFTLLPPSAHGQTVAQRIARLETYVKIASKGYKNGKMHKVQLPRYLAELEILRSKI